MQKYLNWKHQLFKSNVNSDMFFSNDIENKNLFQYKYKYYNEIIQKNIENGFYFPLVNVRNSEFYYLGKHFMVNSDSNAVEESTKDLLQSKVSYIRPSSYVPNKYYSLNLIKYFTSTINSFSYSNVTFFVNADGSKIDLMDYGVFDFVANTFNYVNSSFSNVSYSSLINYEYDRTPEFCSDNTILSSSFVDLYSKSKTSIGCGLPLLYLDALTDINNDFIIHNNYDPLLISDISYEDVVLVSDNTDDSLYISLLKRVNNQLKRSIVLELRNKYKTTISYIVEAIKLKKIELNHKAAEAKILDDFDHNRIGQRKKQRLLITLYSKKKEEELKRIDENKKEKKTKSEVYIENFTNLDYTLDGLSLGSTGLSSSDSILNDDIFYRYESEELGNTKSIKQILPISNDLYDEVSTAASNLDYLNKINYYELNSSILSKKAQVKHTNQHKVFTEEQRGTQIINCLNNLLNYSESNNFDIEKPSDNITEINLSKQYKFLKSVFTSYKSNGNRFPTLYVPYLQEYNSGKAKTINASTIIMYRKRNIHVQLVHSRIKGLFYYPNSNLKDLKFNYYTYWDMNCLYFKFVGLLIRHGKRHKAEELLNNSFIFIKNLSLCNPLYIFMKAIYNGQTFFEFTKQKKQTKSLLIPRYTPLNKRIKISMRLISNNIRNNDLLRKVKKSKKYNVNTSFLLSNIFISYFFKVGKVRNDLVNNVTNAYKQKHLLKKNVSTFVYNRLLKFLAFRKIRGYHISK